MQEISKPIIGLLGGPGAGKSAVAACFAELGYGVINADELNHQVMARREVILRIKEVFGAEIIGENNQIDRRVLGSIVFGAGNTGKLEQLTGILHPEIFKLVEQRSLAYDQNPEICGIIWDIPLLVEVGWEKNCDYLVFVSVSDEIRRGRLQKNRGWDENLIKSVEKNQILLDKKHQISDYTVENNSDMIDLRLQVSQISPKLLK